MSEFNLGQFLTKVVDYSLSGIRGTSTESMQKPKNQPSQESFSKNLIPKQKPQTVILPSVNVKYSPIQNLQMNHLEHLEKALYVKDLMNLPKDMSELLNAVKRNLNMAGSATSLLTSSLSLSQLSLFLQQNGKEAINKLIMTMSNASKQGIDDLSLMKETMKLINASVSLAEQNNPSSVVKGLILLYLPWLPVQDGVGFELEIESAEEKSQGSESSITVLISTKNYGNLKATLVLLAGNSLTVLVNCLESFPKDDLVKNIKAESAIHSVQATVVVEQTSGKIVEKTALKNGESTSPQAKISTSSDSSVNPFLILLANSLIRSVIEIDKSAAS